MNGKPDKKYVYLISFSVLLVSIPLFLYLSNSGKTKISPNSQVKFSIFNFKKSCTLPDPLRSEIISTLNNSEPENIYSMGEPKRSLLIYSIKVEGENYVIVGDHLYQYRKWVSKRWSVKNLQLKLIPHVNKFLSSFNFKDDKLVFRNE